MKVAFNIDRPERSDNPSLHHIYDVPFTLVGRTHIDAVDIIRASQKPGGMQAIEQEILTELSALLQIQLYGRVFSNEGEESKEGVDEKTKI